MSKHTCAKAFRHDGQSYRLGGEIELDEDQVARFQANGLIDCDPKSKAAAVKELEAKAEAKKGDSKTASKSK